MNLKFKIGFPCLFRGIFLAISLMVNIQVHAIEYSFTGEPIDVVIPSTEKDLDTLMRCIRAIRLNCQNIRRVIVISSRPLTRQAEWFDERNFPFSKQDVAYYLNSCDSQKTQEFISSSDSRTGWYLQQLFKLYALYVIPNLSSNVLLLDSDTIFLKTTRFTDSTGAGLYAIGSEFHRPYFNHMNRLIPGLNRVFPNYSGICHHMIIQRDVLDDLFRTVQNYHHTEFWKAFCLCVDQNDLHQSGASEYEIYFNFLFSRTNQAKIRNLKWKNVESIQKIDSYKKHFDYVSCHSYLRSK